MLRLTDKDLYLAEYSRFCTAQAGVPLPTAGYGSQAPTCWQARAGSPAFPLPSATLAKRVSDRERKGWANNPRRSQCSRYGRIWKPSEAISLAKPRTVSSETSYGSRPMFLRLARMLLGTVMIWQPQAFGLVNVDELARGRPQDLAVGLGGGLLDRLRHKRNGVDAGVGDAAGKERDDGRRLGINGLDHLVDLHRRKDGGDVNLDAVGRKLANQLGGGLALGGHARDLNVDVLGPGSDLAGLRPPWSRRHRQRPQTRRTRR